MKQRITKIQLNEISDEQKERLREWWNPQYGDAYYYPKVDSTGNVPHGYRGWEMEDMKTRVFPLLSIGQMFQFLNEIKDNFTLYSDYDFDERTSEPGHVTSYRIYAGHSTESNELVDALWERVKENL